jgi:hypothetical protein
MSKVCRVVPIRMRCQRCGGSLYIASARAAVARGDRCASCGAALEDLCPSCRRAGEALCAACGPVAEEVLALELLFGEHGEHEKPDP